MGGLEAALEATEERVDAALKATAAVNRELKKAKTGAQKGQTAQGLAPRSEHGGRSVE